MINFIQTELQIGNDEQLKAIDMYIHRTIPFAIHHTVQYSCIQSTEYKLKSMRLIHL